MKKLLIVGAGGHGRCCLDIAREIGTFDEIAFLDNKHVKEIINGCSVLDSVDNMDQYYPGYDSIFIAIGNNELRHKLMVKASKIGYEVATLISPFSRVSRYANIGSGTVIFQNAVVEANSRIEKGCVIMSNVTINHDVHVNDYCLIYSNSVIRAESKLGKNCKIGSNCCIRAAKVIEDNIVIDDASVI